MINLVVYDLDGTLIDSAEIVLYILNQMRKESGKQPIDRVNLLPWLSLGGEALVINALGLIQNHDNVGNYLDEFRYRYSKCVTQRTAVYPGVHETLDFLIGAGIKLALCTNKPRNLAEKVLCETELLNKFSFISAGGDLLTQKPSPDNLLICLKNFGILPSNTIFVGDSTVDQMVSNLTKVKFVHYAPGYNDGVHEKNLLKINHHEELLNIIKL